MATTTKKSANKKSASTKGATKRASATKSSARGGKKKDPWKKPAPKRSRHTKLTSAQKAKAKRAAKQAGRPYPNLVDNMRVASKKPKRRARAKGKSGGAAQRRAPARRQAK